jgi:hypothetical protein
VAANANDQISTGTATGLFQFLDYLVDKGYAPPNSISPWRVAARKVFEGMEGEDFGETVILEINPDEYMDRFVNKKRGEYKAESLSAYRTRFKRAVGAYRSYLTEGNEWKPPTFQDRVRSVSAKPASGTGVGTGSRNATTVEIGRATETDIALPIASTPSTLLDYPFPLSTGDLAHLRLPRGLTTRDAERIGAFVKTLAFEPESDSRGRPADH